MPPALVGLVLPAAYLPAVALLPVLAVMGVGLGTTTVLATLLLAVRARRALAAALAAAVAALAAGLALGAGGALAGLPGVPAGPTGGLAAGAALGALAGAVLVALLGAAHRPRPVGPGPGLVRAGAAGATYAVVVVALLAATRLLPGPLAVAGWVVAVGVVGLGLVGLPVLGARVAPSPDPAAGAPDRAHGGLHVLHLAFEDPAMPGSGGGALRTAEIDRRLAAAGHHVTVLTGRYPGATDRVERHGAGSVSWVHPHVGRGRTRLTRLLPYMAAAFLAARRAGRRSPGDRNDGAGPGPVDLVVEDFFAPISSMAIPAWTGAPVVGVVQWLNAREKARQYHLPVHWVERLGVATHRRIVAVSHGVGAATQALTPRAEVVVIGNGVDPVAFTVVRARSPSAPTSCSSAASRSRRRASTCCSTPGRSRPARSRATCCWPARVPTRRRCASAPTGSGSPTGCASSAGSPGGTRPSSSPRARIAAVPSRFETFGIVAAEALAVGTPVVAYDIDCLREVVPAEGGVLVPVPDGGFDTAAYAQALVDLAHDAPRRAVVARRGPEMARVHDWDALAATQDAFYRRVVAESRPAESRYVGVDAGRR